MSGYGIVPGTQSPVVLMQIPLFLLLIVGPGTSNPVPHYIMQTEGGFKLLLVDDPEDSADVFNITSAENISDALEKNSGGNRLDFGHEFKASGSADVNKPGNEVESKASKVKQNATKTITENVLSKNEVKNKKENVDVEDAEDVKDVDDAEDVKDVEEAEEEKDDEEIQEAEDDEDSESPEDVEDVENVEKEEDYGGDEEKEDDEKKEHDEKKEDNEEKEDDEDVIEEEKVKAEENAEEFENVEQSLVRYGFLNLCLLVYLRSINVYKD